MNKITKNNLFSFVLFPILLFVTNLAFAAEVEEEDEQKMPPGCRNVDYKFEWQVLKIFPDGGGRQGLFFIYNALNRPILLHQMRSDESSRSMYLNHTIYSRRWAVLATSENQLKYICTVADANSHYGKIVDCEKSLKVCEYTNVRFGLNNRGNYWLVDNASRSSAVMDVVHYGIVPAH